MSLKTLTRANFRFLDNLPISQFILNFVRPHKTKNITDTIVYVSYARKKIKQAGFMGWRGRGGVTDALYYVQQTWLAYLWRLQTLFQATFSPAPSSFFFLILQSRCEFNDTKFTNTKSKWSRVQSYRPSCLYYGVFAKMDN